MKNIVTEKKCNYCGLLKPIIDFPKIGRKCKSCYREYEKIWVSNNRDKTSKYYKDYAKRNPEKTVLKSKKRYADNKEEILENIKKWRKENIEKVKETAARWRQNNRDKIRGYNKKQRENHPDAVRMNNEKRRAREKNAVGTITEKEWIELKNKHNNKCLCCKRENVKLTLDHVIPLALGGTHTIENAQPLCASCNSKKGKKHIDYR